MLKYIITESAIFTLVPPGIAAIAGSALVAVAASEAIDAPFLQVRELTRFLDQTLLLFSNSGSNYLPSSPPDTFIYSRSSVSSNFSNS